MNSQPTTGGKKNVIVAVAFVAVIILAIIAYVLVQNKNAMMAGTKTGSQKPTMAPDGMNPTQSAQLNSVQATAAPTVEFDKWTLPKQAPPATTTTNVYTFKQNYSMTDVQAIAKKLGVGGNVRKDKDFVMAYMISSDNKDASLLTYNLKTGSLSYASTTGVMATGTDTTVDGHAYSILKDLSIYDDTLRATAHYKRKSKPGMTYVEIHRDWQKVGMPIFNSVGLLNLPETVSLANLSLTSRVGNLPNDADVYGTTDGKDGLTRQTDFNTVTVVVSDKDGKIKGVQSNLRRMADQGMKPAAVISYDDAIKNLQAGKYDFILTTPSGTGDMPWDKVYPGNKAVAAEAVVTDSILAYVEKSALTNQDQLQPYYIFRGHANLLSGYRVNFVASVPALAPKVQSRGFLGLIKQVYAQDTSDTTQKQGTFSTTPGAGTGTGATAGNPSSSTSNPTNTTSTDPAGKCAPSASDLNPILLIGGLKYGWANWRIWGGHQSTSRDGFWYYIPDPGTTDAVILSNLDQILALLQAPTAGTVPQSTPLTTTGDNATSPEGDNTQKQGTFNITPEATPVTSQDITQQELTLRRQQKILIDLGLMSEACPVRLTGASPSLFIYGAEGSKVRVAAKAELTYADPTTDDASVWNVTVHANGLSVNGYDRPFIYYEYKPVNFTKPHAGWVVQKSNLAAVVNEVSAGLKLTELESQRLAFELNHAASSVSSETLYVGLIDRHELDAKLPLSLSPQPAHLYRYHFFVTNADSTDAPVAPHFSPLSRDASSALEFGSYASK